MCGLTIFGARSLWDTFSRESLESQAVWRGLRDGILGIQDTTTTAYGKYHRAYI